jgi:hypothetical protein
MQRSHLVLAGVILVTRDDLPCFPLVLGPHEDQQPRSRRGPPHVLVQNAGESE